MVADELVSLIEDVKEDLKPELDVEDAQPEIVLKGNNYPAFKTRTEDGDKIIQVNLDSFPREERIKAVSKIPGTFEDQEGIFQKQTNEYKKISAATRSSSRVESILGFFSPFLSNGSYEHIALIRRSLAIQQELDTGENLPRHKVDQLKHDLRNDFEYAYVVSNLVSGGYYDKDGYMREIFEYLESESPVERNNYVNIYEQVLQSEPFTVFVGRSDNPNTIRREIKRKISNASSQPIPVKFVDALGLGAAARSVLERAVLETQRDVDSVTFQVQVNEGETRYRFFPETVSGLQL